MDRCELLGLVKRDGAYVACSESSANELHDLIRSAVLVGQSPSHSTRRARARQCIHILQRILEESPQLSLTLADLAKFLNLERTYCCKVFQELTGAYFSDWVRRIRIARAQSMLQLPDYTITEISHAVGYDDITTFSRNFRRELGLTPSSFRRMSAKLINQPTV